MPCALVVVGRALGGAGQHRQGRRGAVQRLDLALLVHREHDGSLGRVQVQAADVVDLLDELRVLGELPESPGGAAATRTRARSASPRPGSARPPGHRPGRPVRRVLRRGLQGRDHDPLDLLVGDRPGPPGRGSSSSPSSRRCSEPVAPLRDRRRARRPRARRSRRSSTDPAAASTIRARSASA